MSERPVNDTKRLYRRSSDRVVGGVASGLADYFGVEPILVRVIFFATTVTGGMGLVVYLLLWAFVPVAGANESAVGRLIGRPDGLRLLGVALIAIALSVAAGAAGLWRTSFLVPLVLIALGAFLLRQPPELGAPGAAATATELAAPPAVAPAPRSVLGWLTVAALLIALGSVGMLDRAGGIELTVGQYPALALLVLGIGLIVGAWRGRARLLILLGIALLPVVAATSMVDFPLSGRVGDVYMIVSSPTQLRPGYEVLAGRTTFDLTKESFGPLPTELDFSVAMGEIDILVPRDTAVEIRAYIDYGQVYAFTESAEGSDLRFERRFGPVDAARTLRITLHGGVASLGVQWRQEWIAPPQPEYEAEDKKPENRGRERKGKG